MRQAFQRMGCAQNAAIFLSSANDGGISDVSTLASLKDDDVESLAQLVRRPGGTAAGGQPHPGFRIPYPTIQRIKLAALYLCFRVRTGQDLDPEMVTRGNIAPYSEYKDSLETREDPPVPEINSRDWPKTIAALEEYFNGCKGSDLSPLGYCIRKTAAPIAAPDDGFDGYDQELIYRTPIHVPDTETGTPAFKTDNRRVWEKLASICRDEDCWTYVSVGQRTHDGRKAFLALKNHYLGEHNHDNMAAKAEQRLRSAKYTGENRRWNFEKYVKLQQDQFNIMDGLKANGQYAGIDAGSKVRYLLAGIQVGTPAMEACKAQIRTNPTLRNNYDSVCGT